ncbi:unnamed protein product [Protopolystoma xenopodis]|uniref:Beta-1,4-galactosyltransferase n=1 Tax=Protopolystoma xenopodis TaxID=117903 RepID=A0A448WXP1_9PLAT|nr:unnamed protein product [Protopolystoma xenopodis]
MSSGSTSSGDLGARRPASLAAWNGTTVLDSANLPDAAMPSNHRRTCIVGFLIALLLLNLVLYQLNLRIKTATRRDGLAGVLTSSGSSPVAAETAGHSHRLSEEPSGRDDAGPRDAGEVRFLKPHRITRMPKLVRMEMLLRYLATNVSTAKTDEERSVLLRGLMSASRLGNGMQQSCNYLCQTHHSFLLQTASQYRPEKRLGRLSLPDRMVTHADVLYQHFASYQAGGGWAPAHSTCLRLRPGGVAIVFPFRNRWPQLLTCLFVLLRVLRRQRLCYRIFVAEQVGVSGFNKGKLNNAGFLEASKLFRFDCIIFHDTDLVPEHDGIWYGCNDLGTRTAIHMAWSVSTFNYILPYSSLIGGVLKIRREHYIEANGYSNVFWRWGGEDDELEMRINGHYRRLLLRHLRYFALGHKSAHDKHIRTWRCPVFFHTIKTRYKTDGLNTANYTLVQTIEEGLFTRFLIDVGTKPPEL